MYYYIKIRVIIGNIDGMMQIKWHYLLRLCDITDIAAPMATPIPTLCITTPTPAPMAIPIGIK
jgi:hypothetical protein